MLRDVDAVTVDSAGNESRKRALTDSIEGVVFRGDVTGILCARAVKTKKSFFPVGNASLTWSRSFPVCVSEGIWP